MENHSLPSFQTLVQKIFRTKGCLDKQIDIFREDITEIEAYYDPRTEFERWRRSTDGKDWKEHQYKKQKGCCAICKEPIPLKGSHIDHIKPMSIFPELNLDAKNMQITCPDCNVKKGNAVKI